MAEDTLLARTSGLINGRFAVDTSQVLPDVGGGIEAYPARDHIVSSGKRVALAVSRSASPHDRALRILTVPIDNLMSPIGHGVAPLAGGKGEGYFIICTSPPGPSLSAGLNAWTEKPLIDLVLRPIARVLDGLNDRSLTHRAIRPNNVFQASRGQPVTLGAAWAAPPAMHQPAAFESPYSAMCNPPARGPGTIADDVYSLGVLLLTLLHGAVPMAKLDGASIIRWKIELGSFAALTRERPVSGFFGDLLHGMLADDPDHRPLPAQLLDIGGLRGRRAAARPPRRSQQPLMLNDIAVFDARMLAYALLSDYKKAFQFIANGLVTQWLRRGLGDASLATLIEDLVRGRTTDIRSGPLSDPLLVVYTISAISPRMPLCWRGIAVWPDGLSGLLAQGMAGQPELMSSAEELLLGNAATSWVRFESRPGRPEPPEVTPNHSAARSSNGLERLFYELNPLLPCRARGMESAWVADIPALMRHFEQTASKAGATLIDLHLSAFIAAHADRKSAAQVENLTTARTADSLRHGELALLRDLQVRFHPEALPALAAWVVNRLQPDLERWRNRPRREAIQARLEVLAQAGYLARLLELTNDIAARALDMAGAIRAANEVAAIDAEVGIISNEDHKRRAEAERHGQAITGGIGLSALILMVLSVLLR
jgi:eukaryotic-like serine/threonine-protein kinase